MSVKVLDERGRGRGRELLEALAPGRTMRIWRFLQVNRVKGGEIKVEAMLYVPMDFFSAS